MKATLLNEYVDPRGSSLPFVMREVPATQMVPRYSGLRESLIGSNTPKCTQFRYPISEKLDRTSKSQER